MSITDETERLCRELQATLAITEKLVKGFSSSMTGRGVSFSCSNLKPMEVDMSNSMRDAFMKSANGEKLIVQVQETKDTVARRIRSLKELVHYTFVEYPKANDRRVRFDVYQRSKDHVRELGIEGGEEYDKAYTALKFARTSYESFVAAIEAVCPPEHSVHDYESSDGVSRYQ